MNFTSFSSMVRNVAVGCLTLSSILFTPACGTIHVPGPANPPPSLSGQDSLLFTKVQRQTFRYFWEGAEPHSGMALERLHIDDIYTQHDKDIVTTGGSGFGIMAILTGIERNFITRTEGRERLEKIVGFLEGADRFHGAWPHWMEGATGKVKPFSKKDDGGDLVETSFLLEGLLCARQYFREGSAAERALARRIDSLWRSVDFDWYRQGKQVLYWHWSPDYGWEMNFAVHGYNECLIMYILAASSPTHAITPEVYHQGWGDYRQKDILHAPLFWAHYSYLGLDPRGLKDQYADYWEQNKQQALTNYQWCVDDSLGYKGYGKNSWGLTSSYSMKGYSGHAPTRRRDLGVIAPTAALSSFPYTPEESFRAMRHWYNDLKDKLWGPYGFYDAFSEQYDWYPQRYLAIDQGPIVVMMENYRSGFLWRLFMNCPEVRTGLRQLGFESPWLKKKN
ncbi:MAG TPA: glucoamylase family protein [Puia sp.]|nr:glucoamylase family protein [Puia sp.]